MPYFLPQEKLLFWPYKQSAVDNACYTHFLIYSLEYAILTFESVDQILLCDHSNETSSVVLSHGTICLSMRNKQRVGIFLNSFSFLLLVVVKWFKYYENKTECLC